MTPMGLAINAAGSIVVAETGAGRVRRVELDGTWAIIAGSGQLGCEGDGGPAIEARLRSPRGVAVDAEGNIYVAEHFGHCIRKIDGLGAITTVAGTGRPGLTGDLGPATTAELRNPNGIAIDERGRLLVADTGNHRIRMISEDGIIATVAGTIRGFAGDHGPAPECCLDSPVAVTWGPEGAYIICDAGNRRVRWVTAAGEISTVASSLYRAAARRWSTRGPSNGYAVRVGLANDGQGDERFSGPVGVARDSTRIARAAAGPFAAPQAQLADLYRHAHRVAIRIMCLQLFAIVISLPLWAIFAVEGPTTFVPLVPKVIRGWWLVVVVGVAFIAWTLGSVAVVIRTLSTNPRSGKRHHLAVVTGQVIRREKLDADFRLLGSWYNMRALHLDVEHALRLFSDGTVERGPELLGVQTVVTSRRAYRRTQTWSEVTIVMTPANRHVRSLRRRRELRAFLKPRGPRVTLVSDD